MQSRVIRGAPTPFLHLAPTRIPRATATLVLSERLQSR